MNVIKVMGGLGNQLFQYAFGRMQRLNAINVAFANSSYTEDKIEKQTWKRNYVLDKFCTDVRIRTFYPPNKVIRESKVGYNKDLLRLDRHNFHGYWQYLNYYKNHLEIFQEEFKLRPGIGDDNTKYLKLKSQIAQEKNSVSVHVRRGDYVVIAENFEHFIQPFKYYLESLNYLNTLTPIDTLYIFSDDIAWCKDHFKKEYFNNPIVFVEGFEDYLDFDLMKHCKHNIISASTFSWWAAWLNDNADKKVICPLIWDDYKSNESIYPKEWIKF